MAHYQFSVISILYLASSLGVILLATGVLVHNSEDKGNRSFFILSLSITLWLSGIGLQLASVSQTDAMRWYRVWSFFGVVHIGPQFVLIASVMRDRLRQRKWLIIAVHLISLGFYFTANTSLLVIDEMRHMSWGYYPQYGPLGIAFIVYFFILMAYSIRELQIARNTSQDILRQKQVHYFLIAVCVGLIGATDFIPAFGANWHPIGYAALFAFSGIDGVALIRFGGTAFESVFPYQLVLNSLPTFVIGVGLDGKIRFTNDVIEQNTGYSSAQIVGKPVEFLFPDLAFDATNGSLVPATTNGETYLKYGNDHSIPVRFAITPVRKRDILIGHVINALDLTEEKNLEQQLIESQKMEALGQIAGGIAHDFNNVMATIHGANQLLELKIPDGNGESESEYKQYLRMIQSSIERGKTVTERMLTFTRTETPEFQPISAMSYLKKIQSIALHTLPKDVDIALESFEKSDLILADRGQIQQVLLNLCINASDAMPEGGEIRMGLSYPTPERVQRCTDSDTSAEKFLCIYVRDNGKGMDEDTLNQIFDPFFTTKAPGKGTGLGLATVQKIIKNHEGWLDVESTVGEGTTFYIGLPRHQGKLKRPPTQSIETADQGAGEHILVVEDEQSLQMLLKEYLSGANYHVSIADDGAEALEIYENNSDSIALVITDLGLPNVSGKKLATTLKKRDPGLPIVATTGYINAVEEHQLTDFGFRRVLHKPFDIQKVLVAVTEILKQP